MNIRKLNDPMGITLELTPEIKARLIAQAAAQGITT